MKITSFLFSLLLFLWYLFNHRGKGREEEQQIINDVTEEEKAPIEDYYTERLRTLNKMLLLAQKEEQREQSRLNHINTLNQYGIIVNEKNVKRVESDLYKAQRKRLAIENQIYTAEKRREKENAC